MPSPSVRRHGGPDELLAEVRTKVFVDGTVPSESPELPRRVHVLAAHCRHQLRHGTRSSGRTDCHGPDDNICARHRAVGCAGAAKACSRAHGTMPSPSVRRHGGPDELLAEVRTKVFVDVTVPRDSPELPRRVHVLAAHCRHHPRHETKEVRKKPFFEVRTTAFAHGTVPWDAPELPRRVHVLAAHTRHHPGHGTGRSGGSHLPRSGGKYMRTSPCC